MGPRTPGWPGKNYRQKEVASDILPSSYKQSFILTSLSKFASFCSSFYNLSCSIIQAINHEFIFFGFMQKVHKRFAVDNVSSLIKEVSSFTPGAIHIQDLQTGQDGACFGQVGLTEIGKTCLCQLAGGHFMLGVAEDLCPLVAYPLGFQFLI